MSSGALRQGCSDIVCPQCRTLLKQQDSRLGCASCGNNWPVVAGVPHFVDKFPYWGEIPAEHIGGVLEAAAKDWKSALVNSPAAEVQKAAGMILNLDRANWQWLLDLPAGSRALDIGAGMGTISHALALHYASVVALEPVLERVEFMRRRFCQERLDNVSLIRGSVWTIPFPNNSFDLVAMNGVLEWVPEGGSEDPAVLQKRAIRRVYDLLKPGGYFYIGIENRTAHGSFIGYRDPHCGVPFVTILPRPLAHWYARRKGQPAGYRNYLYSARGYRKLLVEAGFASSEVYLALPSYNHPRYLIPLDGNLFAYYINNFTQAPAVKWRRLLSSVLLRAGLLKHLQYSYVILGRK